jgi:D-amino-acid dehydrogenase
MHSQGLLMAFMNEENLQHHVANLDLVRRAGLDRQVLIGDDVRAHEPLLSDRVHGGIVFPRERHLDPAALVRSLRERLLELGVTIVEHAAVTAVRKDRGRGTTVLTEAGPVDGDAFVLAAGA